MLRICRTTSKLVLAPFVFLLAAAAPAWALAPRPFPPAAGGFVSSIGGSLFAVPSQVAVVGFAPPFLPPREDRGVFEFDLQKITNLIEPDGALVSATLEIAIRGACLPAAPFLTVHVHGYAGDGVVTTADFAAGALLTTLAPISTDPFEAVFTDLDVTDLVRTLASRFVGFSLRMDPSTTPGCVQAYGALRVEFVPAAVIRDAFLCYRAVPITQGGTGTTHLVDEFDDRIFSVGGLDALCSPAAAAGESIHDPAIHLAGHQIRPAPGEPPYSRRNGVKLVDQFGTLDLDLLRPRRLLTPVATSTLGLPLPPDPASHDVDSFECYDVGQTAGQPHFTPIGSLTIHDGFTDPGRAYSVLRPVRLCSPVERDGGPIKHPARHLVCYLVGSAPGQGVRKPVGDVFVAGDIVDARIDVLVPRELCVPAFED